MKLCLFALTTYILLTAGAGNMPAQIQGDLPGIADLTPIVDTLWTRRLADWYDPSFNEVVDFQASVIGGSPQTMIVAYVITNPTSERRLMIVNPISGDTIRSLRSGHGATVQYMSFARNANLFATSESGLIKVWRWPEMVVAREFRGPSINRTAGVLTSDGSRIYDAASGVMYDVMTGDTLWKWKPSLNFAWPKLTPDDRYLLLHDGHPDYPYQDRGFLLDAATGQILGSFPGGAGSELIDAMAVSDDGRYVAISRVGDDSPPTDGSVYIYDRQVQQTILKKRYPGYEIGGFELAFAPNNTGLLVVIRGMTRECDIEWLPAWQSGPQKCFAWMGAHFSSDFRLNYNGFGGGRIGVSSFNLGAVAVEEKIGTQNNVVYPNPSDGTIAISVQGFSDGPIHCEIASITGQLIYSGFTSMVGGMCTIFPKPTLLAGSYTLRLMRDSGLVFSFTLIIR